MAASLTASVNNARTALGIQTYARRTGEGEVARVQPGPGGCSRG